MRTNCLQQRFFGAAEADAPFAGFYLPDLVRAYPQRRVARFWPREMGRSVRLYRLLRRLSCMTRAEAENYLSHSRSIIRNQRG